jgi:hypothetical protein
VQRPVPQHQHKEHHRDGPPPHEMERFTWTCVSRGGQNGSVGQPRSNGSPTEAADEGLVWTWFVIHHHHRLR